MRLIDADELLKKTDHWKEIVTSDISIRMIDAFEKGISEVPTVPAIPVAVLRSLFIERMTLDSETKDRRRRDYNQAIFNYRSDGSTFQCFSETDMDMVLEAFDNAVKDYFTGNIAKGKKLV